MEVSHSFRFRWNDHVPHLSQIFTELRYDEVYCDTTLISDDGYVLKAHGAVLSVTSRYFERVLCDVTSDQHPIIVLKGANFMELSCLLDYIYQGVTQVDQHLMEAVLDVADMLEIKGLSKMKNNLSIKKLIAPSPPSSAAMSRGSAQSSSPSKSPSPTSQSPSCSSSPIDNYASSSMLKVDAEDINDLSELSAKSKHSYSDGNTQLRTTECQDYAPNTSKYSICQNNEFLDQTLGIDLSLSRATNEESERVASNNFHLYEDPALRKRKVMVEEAVPHKKKKLFRRPVAEENACGSQFHLPSHPSRRGSTSSRALIADCDILSPCDFEKAASQKTKHTSMSRRCVTNEDVHQMSLDWEVKDVLKTLSSRSDQGTRPSSEPVRLIKQNPYSLAADIARQKSAEKSRRSLSDNPGSYSDFQSPNLFLDHEGRISVDISSSRTHDAMSTADDSILSDQPTIHEQCNPPQLYSDQTDSGLKDFVSVQLLEAGSSHNPPHLDDVTAEAFRVMEYMDKLRRPKPKIKRPLTKYNLFLKENFQSVSKQHPEKKTFEIVKILSGLWQNLPEIEKQQWEEKAKEIQKEFKARHPDYVFSPKQTKLETQLFDLKRADKRNLFRINPI